MASSFEFKKNFDLKKIAEEKIERTQKELERELESAAREIVSRTRSGHDVDGSTFEPYTAQYRKRKTKSGRSANVDLTYSGRMLAAITSKVERVGNDLLGTLFFNNPQDAAKARGNLNKRKFFGLSKEQIERLIQKMRNALNERN